MHNKDYYFNKAKQENYRSRAVYKLIEIENKHKLIAGSSSIILDLGSSPGGWSQLARKVAAKNVEIFAVDLLPMVHIPYVKFFQQDFNEFCIENKEHIYGNVDLIISDMAPNMSGVQKMDHLRSMQIVENVFDIAQDALKLGGSVIIKIFHGIEEKKLVDMLRKQFKAVHYYKPDASKKKSNEIYLVCHKKL